MIENVTTALQVNVTTGNGFTVTLPGPRFLTFKVQGNGNHGWSCGNYAGPNAISNAISFAKFNSGSHDAVIRVYDAAGNVVETHEHTGESSTCTRLGSTLTISGERDARRWL